MFKYLNVFSASEIRILFCLFAFPYSPRLTVRFLMLETTSDHIQHRAHHLIQLSPTFSASGISFMEENFSMDRGKEGMVWWWFKGIVFIAHFVSIVIASAPPQIVRHWIPEAGTTEWLLRLRLWANKCMKWMDSKVKIVFFPCSGPKVLTRYCA